MDHAVLTPKSRGCGARFGEVNALSMVSPKGTRVLALHSYVLSTERLTCMYTVELLKLLRRDFHWKLALSCVESKVSGILWNVFCCKFIGPTNWLKCSLKYSQLATLSLSVCYEFGFANNYKLRVFYQRHNSVISLVDLRIHVGDYYGRIFYFDFFGGFMVFTFCSYVILFLLQDCIRFVFSGK